jgi:hypothetical protein
MAYYNAPTPIPSWGTTAESTGGILKLAKGEWAPGLWAGSEGATIRITGPTIVVDVRVLSVDLNRLYRTYSCWMCNPIVGERLL